MKSKNLKKLLVCTMSLVMSASLLVGCKNAKSTATSTQATTSSTTSTTQKKAKYVFLFIGDGNAMPQISAAENFLGAQNDKTPNAKRLCFSTFPAQGMNTTYSSDSFITDSAASGTAIATGNKTNSGEISMATDMKTKYKTLGEIAKDQDMKVGIVTSVTVNHATPAVFYAHNKSRHNYYDIGLDLVNSNFDYFAGGNIHHAKEDGKEDLYKLAQDKGYKVTKTKEDFDKLTSGSKKVLATSPILDNDGALPYAIDKDSNKITLADFTKKGIDVLDNSKGFFMMVEGGKIDWACHANDAASSIYDTLAFNDSVKEALKFYDKHPDETLIVVTADHETGGLTLGFAGTGYSNFYDKLKAQKISYVTLEDKVTKYAQSHKTNAKFEDLMGYITENFGLTTAKGKPLSLSDYELTKLKNAFNKSMKLKNAKDTDAFIKSYKEEETLLYGTYDPLSVTVTHILNQKAGIAWTSYSHTGIPIPTFAKGVGEEAFNGYYDNTDIFKKLNSIIAPK